MMDFRNLKVGDEVALVSGRDIRVMHVQQVYRSELDTLAVVNGTVFRLHQSSGLAWNNNTVQIVEPTQDLRDEAERQRLSDKIRAGLAFKTLDELRKIAWVSDHEELFEIPEG